MKTLECKNEFQICDLMCLIDELFIEMKLKYPKKSKSSLLKGYLSALTDLKCEISTKLINGHWRNLQIVFFQK